MGGGESFDANERTGRAARHGRPITEEQRKNGKKATVSSSAKSGLEKPWHRLRANQRHVRRSAGKAQPGGRAFTRVCKEEESLKRVSIYPFVNALPLLTYSYSHQGKPFLNLL
jgi:hypothetical protein